MGLASALSTSLTGMSAAETTIDVVGNNLANSATVGFKASRAIFSSQFLETQGLGSTPTETSGGTNPRQIGLGFGHRVGLGWQDSHNRRLDHNRPRRRRARAGGIAHLREDLHGLPNREGA